MDDVVEFELKLAGPKADLARAFDRFAAGQAALHVAEASPAKRLSAVYYDTPDRRLRGRGAALRVRREGDRFVQALKIARGPLDRSEHEAPMAGMRPDLDRLPEHLRPRLGALYREDLAPVFATDVERRTRQVTHDDGLGHVSRVEIAFDEGQITTDTAAEPVCELEVELKDGDRALVFGVAQRLVDAGATRLSTRPKAARGYDLADAGVPRGVKAGRVRLTATDTVGDALGRILDAVYRQWLANQDAAYDGRDAEGVHQLRVAVRRLRSALTLFAPLFTAERLQWLKTEARWVMATLGTARDLDVFALDMLPPVATSRPNDAALAHLRSRNEEARVRAYEALRQLLETPRYTHFVLGLGQWVVSRGWYADAAAASRSDLGRPLRGYAGGVLDQRAKAVRKRGRHFAELDVAARHDLRKRLKKLRYATDFFRDLYPVKPTRRYLKRLARLQDAFGHLNDMAVAEQVLDGLVAPDDARLFEAKGLVLGYYAHAGLLADAELRRDWEDFRRTVPFWSRDAAC